MPEFTPTQGRYLSFIHTYTSRHGCPPAESEIAAAMCVSPPSVNQMVKKLEKKGLILRQPGVPRSIRLLVPEDEIPPLRGSGRSKRPSSGRKQRNYVPASPPTNLYVLAVYLMSGPVSEKFASKVISRVIEIRGDQTLQRFIPTAPEFAPDDRTDCSRWLTRRKPIVKEAHDDSQPKEIRQNKRVLLLSRPRLVCHQGRQKGAPV